MKNHRYEFYRCVACAQLAIKNRLILLKNGLKKGLLGLKTGQNAGFPVTNKSTFQKIKRLIQ